MWRGTVGRRRSDLSWRRALRTHNSGRPAPYCEDMLKHVAPHTVGAIGTILFAFLMWHLTGGTGNLLTAYLLAAVVGSILAEAVIRLDRRRR